MGVYDFAWKLFVLVSGFILERSVGNLVAFDILVWRGWEWEKFSCSVQCIMDGSRRWVVMELGSTMRLAVLLIEAGLQVVEVCEEDISISNWSVRPLSRARLSQSVFKNPES